MCAMSIDSLRTQNLGIAPGPLAQTLPMSVANPIAVDGGQNVRLSTLHQLNMLEDLLAQLAQMLGVDPSQLQSSLHGAPTPAFANANPNPNFAGANPGAGTLGGTQGVPPFGDSGTVPYGGYQSLGGYQGVPPFGSAGTTPYGGNQILGGYQGVPPFGDSGTVPYGGYQTLGGYQGVPTFGDAGTVPYGGYQTLGGYQGVPPFGNSGTVPYGGYQTLGGYQGVPPFGDSGTVPYGGNQTLGGYQGVPAFGNGAYGGDQFFGFSPNANVPYGGGVSLPNIPRLPAGGFEQLLNQVGNQPQVNPVNPGEETQANNNTGRPLPLNVTARGYYDENQQLQRVQTVNIWELNGSNESTYNTYEANEVYARFNNGVEGREYRIEVTWANGRRYVIEGVNVTGNVIIDRPNR